MGSVFARPPDMPRQDLGARALKFSVEILALNRRLLPKSERFGGALNQLVRSATAIGANVEEAQVANSRREMAAKYAVALREARETLYWLRLRRLTRWSATSPLSSARPTSGWRC